MMINPTSIITAMIFVCLALIALMVLAKPLKFLFKVIINAVVGSGVIAVLGILGVNIGVNLLTASFVGLLGIPGLAGLVVLQYLL